MPKIQLTSYLPLIVATFIHCFASLGLAETFTRENSKEAIKIGAMLCLTGDCAEWGQNSLKGAQLAVQTINAKGGVLGRNLELVVQDSHDTSPSDAVSAFRKLMSEKNIDYLVGPTWTVAGMPIAPLAAREKQLIVASPSVGLRDFNETADNILNLWPHDEIATRKLARYALAQGYRRAAIFGSQDPWVKTQSEMFESEFKKGGGEISVVVEPLPGSRSLKSEAVRLRQSKPDVVFFSNYQADVFAKELRILKFDVPKVSILMEKDRVKSAAGALEGTVFALYEEPSAAFRSNFKKQYNQDPGITADTAYDAVMLYARAASSAETLDSSKVLSALLGTSDYVGASGRFSLNPKGAVDKKPVLWMVKGLEYIKVSNSVD